MPLNSIPPKTSTAALDQKKQAAQGKCATDVGFWGGAIPGNVAELRPLWEAGVFGFKCFLVHSGVDEFPPLDPDEMEADMAILKAFDSLMIVHAADARAIARAPPPEAAHYARFLAYRPPRSATVPGGP